MDTIGWYMLLVRDRWRNFRDGGTFYSFEEATAFASAEGGDAIAWVTLNLSTSRIVITITNTRGEGQEVWYGQVDSGKDLHFHIPKAKKAFVLFPIAIPPRYDPVSFREL